MWDEEQFFHDFVSASDHVKMDEAFVDELKKMAADDDKNQQWLKRMNLIRTAAVFAIIMLVCMIGIGVFLKTQKSQIGSNSLSSLSDKADLHAGNEETSIYVGTIGGKSEIEKAIDYIENKEITVLNQEDEFLSNKERSNLLEQLHHAKHIVERTILEELKNDADFEEYKIEENNMVIKRYASGYIVINDTALYQIQE
ncbi:MAG: hypothetical protein II919_06480 [Lachnospiraceae bacterium]|nr:hypothetical protein [Lachnospiraceae bacterium]